MRSMSLAGLFGLASLGAQAQVPPFAVAPQPVEIVTATRSLVPALPTLRDALVIGREQLDEAGNLSLAELLMRRAGVEFRATGGPGQPTGLFMRGANSAHTLVLVDGIRIGSATVGATSVENLPLDMIERIEVVKGPLSSLYGSDAIGGVVQVFTRGTKVPHFFATAAIGEDSDQRISAGITGVDANTSFSLALGARKVDAPSATNERNFCHDPDGDPYENAFFSAQAAHKLWQGETLSFTGFVSRGKTHFDGCSAPGFTDRNDQTLTGVGIASATEFMPGWTSRLAYNHGRDEILIKGEFPAAFETRQDQLSWVNEVSATAAGALLFGGEILRQKVISADTPFTKDEREILSAFTGVNQAWAGGRFEASVRYDHENEARDRTTGSASYGQPWTGVGYLSATYGTGYRTPTFFDLYGPTSDFYQPNPDLRAERSKSVEVALRSNTSAPLQWRFTAFDNRIEDLITYVFPTVQNVRRARIRGVEATVDTAWFGIDWRGALTVQRPEDEDTGKRLPARAEQFGSLGASKRFGESWTVGATLLASGERYDSVDESESSRLPGYAVVDARVRYAISKRWSAELTATNLFDKKYESAVGYDAPRRGVLLSLRFDAF